METKFDNLNRNRYYGLRIGDVVEQKFHHHVTKGEVVNYGVMDNNAVYIKTESGDVVKVIAEWCDIIEKVKDRKL